MVLTSATLAVWLATVAQASAAGGNGALTSGWFAAAGAESQSLRDISRGGPPVDASPAEDRLRRVEGRYEYRRYPFDDLFMRGFDAGVGIQGIGRRVTFARRASTFGTQHNSESTAAVACVAAARVRRWSRWSVVPGLPARDARVGGAAGAVLREVERVRRPLRGDLRTPARRGRDRMARLLRAVRAVTTSPSRRTSSRPPGSSPAAGFPSGGSGRS